MSIDSIYSAASTTHAAHHTGSKSPASQSAQTGTSTANTIEDTISLSAEARKGVAVDRNVTVKGAVRVDGATATAISEKFSEFDTRIELGRQYGEEQRQFLKKQNEQIHALVDKLHQEYGGSFSGAVIPNDFNKPITTLSGSPHPDADAIRSFLQDHKSEWDQLMALGKETFPSFQDWKSQQG